MKQVLILAAFLSSSAAMADDPPGIVWEREYDFPSIFNDVVVASDGKIVCCGGTTTGLDLWCFDGDGDLLWQTGGGGTYTRGAARVISPPSGGYAVAGTCGLASGSGHDLYVSRYDAYGTAIWNTALERLQSEDYGCDIAYLPDGGFAVCGDTTDASLGNQAWILRFDSAGDTLWTRTLGWSYSDEAIALAYLNDGITVLVDGRPQGSDYRPILLRYDFAGNLLWTSYEEFSGYPCDLCSTSSGYALMRKPNLMGDGTTFYVLDESGVIHQEVGVAAGGMQDMHTIQQTIDCGYLISGADDYHDEPPVDDWNAHLSRYDQNGNWMWTHSLESGNDNWFYSATQIPQGGYVAAGQHYTYENVIHRGFMVRFAPETGIEQPVLSSSLSIQSCVPNPGTAVFTLNWTLGLPAATEITIYDVSGRQRLVRGMGLAYEGEHSTQLDLHGLPSGCYLVVVSCGSERASTKLVLLR